MVGRLEAGAPKSNSDHLYEHRIEALNRRVTGLNDLNQRAQASLADTKRYPHASLSDID